MELPWNQQLQMKVHRNSDFQEVTLERDGRAVLRFALAYGFRNIQTIVRPLHASAHFMMPLHVLCRVIHIIDAHRLHICTVS
jgi:hypothetical protein